jgi:hypothetical protein
VDKSGLDTFRLKVQLNTVGTTLLVDGAVLYLDSVSPDNPAGLVNNGGFELGKDGWGSGTNGSIKVALHTDAAAAHSGQNFLEVTNQGSAGLWLSQDASSAVENGTYSAGVWVKSATPGTPFAGVLRAGAAGNGTVYTDTPFTVGDEWSYVTTQFTVSKAGFDTFRLKVQLNTVGTNLLVDSATLYLDDE